MSGNELLLREQLDATNARVSKSETTQTTRVLRDDELDVVSARRSKVQVRTRAAEDSGLKLRRSRL
jgi:hypothetical protein